MTTDWPALVRRWLGRLSFSFLVVGFFLGYQAHQRYLAAGALADWRTLLYGAGAAASVLLGFAGVRERHRGKQ